jgi:hypothetical protein
MGMMMEATLPHPAIKPKIGRLPALQPAKDRRPLLMAGAAALAFGVVLAMASTREPPAEALPAEAETAALPPATEATPAAELPEEAPTVEMATPTPPPASRNDTLSFQDGRQGIVGQMAKIPAQNLPSIEVRTVTNVDNAAGRELLSIVNKY